MKKKFYGALLVGSLLLAGGMVSCSDYDDDINSLSGRVDALEKTVADLKTAIESGSVITNVQSTENGVTVTLSDGKTFELKNGTNGANGAPGSVVEIGDNGNWFIDRIDTGRPAKGDQGEQGPAGPAGPDGKDGCWYMPGEDGYWHKQYTNEDGTVADEVTDQKWTDTIKKDVVCVVYDSENGRLLISNAAGMQEGEVVLIETWGELKSLAVIPYVIDKETSMPVVSFYNIMKDGTVLESTDATAHFRLNPNNANIKDWEWSIIDRKAVTRAEGDNVNDLLNISDITRADGEMIVSLKSKKSISDLNEDEIAIFALNGTNTANGNNIASDYAKVTSEDLTDFAIVNESMPREFVTEYVYPTTIPNVITDRNDAELVYTGSIDLNTLAWTWAKDIDSFHGVMLEDLDIDGLTYEFSKPEEYLGSDKTTNQQDFVELSGSIVTVKNNATAAIGRTPIFLAKALVNGTVIATGYIKLDIVSAPAEDLADEVLTVPCGTINYQELDAIGRENSAVNSLAWQTVNDFYSKYGLTSETFKEHYYSDVIESKEEGVKLKEHLWSNPTATASGAVEIDMDPTLIDVVSQLGKERVATMTFKSKNPKKYPNLVVKFTYTIADNITFPALNTDYLVAGEKNMVEVKGRVEGSTWEMISGIKEHFNEYLTNYQLAPNHSNMYAELPLINGVAQAGAEIVTNATEDKVYIAKKQDIKLIEQLTTTSRDYIVNFNIVLANGEVQTEQYTVRFTTPYSVSINPLQLKTLASPDYADLAKAIVIKGAANEVIYENGAIVEKNANVYKITANSYFQFAYSLDGSDSDSWASFGNNLTIDEATGKITWDNDGAILQNNKTATSKVTVTAGDIAVINETGTVKVLSSENSKN